MQAQPGHRAAPLVGTVGGRVHEVQHGQQGPAAGGQDGEFVAVLAQHRIARVNHVERGVGVQRLGQDAGLLFVAAVRFGRVEEAADARRAVQPFFGAIQPLQVLQQGDAVFHPGRVEPFEHGAAFQAQPRAFDVARGAGAVGHLAERGVAREGAQERGLAGVGVAHHRDLDDVDGVGRQAQGQQPFAPQRGARARAGLILGPRDEPHAGSLRVSGQFGDQGQGAAVGRLAGVASDQQPRGRGLRKRVQHAVAFFPRVQVAGHLDARGHVRGRPGQVGGQLQA
ncbi:hypothetical protein G6F35_012342 [Rhizopus arrhizus]|nr:hypothetical protein G6F35_012342 [Rhizopus arrhizus]